ncbi:MAG: M48 family metallopeptidase [Candidatus Omnitrophica bacterium]|nr:M48 family metallopeptidase [Candidatus Omnitrophota bacterium]
MKNMIKFFLIILLFSGCAPTLQQPELSKEAIEQEREKQKEIVLFTIIDRKIRLYKVGLTLLKGALNYYNKNPKISFGVIVHSNKSYSKEDLPIIRKKYLVEDIPTILYLHPDFGGYKGGLKVNDKIIEINGKKIKDLDSYIKIINELDISITTTEFLIEREKEILKFNVNAEKICPFDLILTINPEVSDTINSWTDGKRIYVTPGLLRFLQSDNELALVLSHEIAHAILDHVQKMQGNIILGTIFDIAITIATGVNTQGIFGNIGGLIYSKEFEKEADYLGTYICAVSGYDVSNAPNLWRKMAAEYPGSTKDIFLATHPSSPERYILIEKTVKEIEEKRKKGLPLTVEFKK